MLFHNLVRINTVEDRPSSPPDLRDGHGIVTPFILCILGGILVFIYVVFFVKETAFRKVAQQDQDSTTATSTDKHSFSAAITPLRALFPIKLADGTLDWRITALFFYIV